MDKELPLDDATMDTTTFQMDEREAAQTNKSIEEAPEQTKAWAEYAAAVETAIRDTPIKGPDDWATQLARNQALDKLRGGRTKNPVPGGRLPEDDPDFIEPDWGHLKYDPKPASGFAVTAKRRRLSTEEIARRRAELETKQKLAKIVDELRALLSARVTPGRNKQIGTLLGEARGLLDERGAWDTWIESIPISRAASYAFLKAASVGKSPKNLP